MSTDKIAKVFKMDTAEVVKILERAARSTSKDGVDMGTMRLGHDNENILQEIEVQPLHSFNKFDMFQRCLGLRHLDQAVQKM